MDYISVTEEQHKKLCDLFELQYQPIEFEPIKYDGPALVSPVGSEERKAMWDDPNHIYNSPKFRKKISDTVKKQMKDPARLKQMSEQGKQNWKKPNSVFNTPEYRKKLVENNPRYWTGKERSEETKEKCRQANLGKKQSEETKLKRINSFKKRKALNLKPNYKDSTCPHCNLTGKSFNMTRYHFDNCKKKVNILCASTS